MAQNIEASTRRQENKRSKSVLSTSIKKAELKSTKKAKAYKHIIWHKEGDQK